MKTITEYLSGKHDQELRVLVAETRGWMKHPCVKDVWRSPEQCKKNVELLGTVVGPWTPELEPPSSWTTSLDACHEFLEDLTEEEWGQLHYWLGYIFYCTERQPARVKDLMTAHPRQICVAWLLAKGVLTK